MDGQEKECRVIDVTFLRGIVIRKYPAFMRPTMLVRPIINRPS